MTRSLNKLALFCLLPSFALAQTTPAMKLPADRAALNAARAIADPDAEIAALRKFLTDFPDSKSADTAHTTLLQLLLANHPDDVKAIHTEAKLLVDHAAPGTARGNEENTVAYDLAEALPNGVDLKSAEKWAKAATGNNTEAAFDADITASAAKYKQPAPKPSELHSAYAGEEASYLQTLADVLFHEGKLSEASTVLDRAFALDPTEGAIFLTRGQIAHAQHHDDEALDDLELAQLRGGITSATAPLLHQLYAQAHNGSEAGFDAEMDTRYKQLFPAPFTPTASTVQPTGRTVLMELFTGAGCEPCVGADLAMDGLLEAYPRTELIALSYDLHIPLPDPLANADTVARSTFYSVKYTPSGFLDGQMGPEIGSRRDGSEANFKKLSEAIDKQIAAGSAVDLKLTAALTPDHQVVAHAAVTVTDPKVLDKLLNPASAADTKPTPAASEPPAPAKLILNFALVQQTVRYSGENGVRFHHMIVRALAKPSEVGFPVDLTAASKADATFDPAAVSAALTSYLTAFAKHSERFGVTHFLSTDTTLPMDQLAVVAWVEDPTSHHVVQAVFAPLQPAAQEAAR